MDFAGILFRAFPGEKEVGIKAGTLLLRDAGALLFPCLGLYRAPAMDGNVRRFCPRMGSGISCRTRERRLRASRREAVAPERNIIRF